MYKPKPSLTKQQELLDLVRNQELLNKKTLSPVKKPIDYLLEKPWKNQKSKSPNVGEHSRIRNSKQSDTTRSNEGSGAHSTQRTVKNYLAEAKIKR